MIFRSAVVVWLTLWIILLAEYLLAVLWGEWPPPDYDEWYHPDGYNGDDF